ncbi:fimbrial protein [Salmonella enterica]|nr:fimbrial protein [Salmonella enterica]
MNNGRIACKLSRPVIGVFLFSFSIHAFGATECFFNGAKTDTLTFASQSVDITSPVSDTKILKDNIKGSVIVTTSCNAGKGGQDLNSKQSGVAVTSTTINGVKVALFPTNVTGIVYGIKFVSNSEPPTGYIAMSTDYTTVFSVDDDHDKEYWKGKSGHFDLTLFQTRDYVPGQGHTITPNANMVGDFRIGSQTDAQDIQINNNSFTLNIPQPTCDAATLENSDNASGTQVNLGDYYTSELIGNKRPKKIPFTIKLTGCGGVNHLITKLTSQYVSPYSNSMLADINNAQRGVGVQIYSTNDVALIPNDANSYYSVQDSSTPDTREANFYAVLSDDGKGVITTGTFKTMGTFTFTYN